MMLSTTEAQAMQTLVLLALALLIAGRAFGLSPTWTRRALVLGAACLGAALIVTVVAWYT